MNKTEMLRKAKEIERFVQGCGIDFKMPAIGSPIYKGVHMSSKLLLVFAFEMGFEYAKSVLKEEKARKPKDIKLKINPDFKEGEVTPFSEDEILEPIDGD